MSRYYFSDEDFEELADAMASYGSGGADAVTSVLHDDAAPIIMRYIDEGIPVSRRSKEHAKGASWERYDKDERLAVTVATKYAYHYLYFPDDGTNTVNHAGEQYFFEDGADRAAPEVIDMCLDRLAEKFGF